MKLTIIPSDKTVYVDGLAIINLDLSSCGIPENIHALQWDSSKGWIEFKNLNDGTKPENQIINSLPSWANACKQKWDAAKPVIKSNN